MSEPPPNHAAVTETVATAEQNGLYISSISEFLNILQRREFFASAKRLFRGQSNCDWPLLSKAGRPEYYPVGHPDLDECPPDDLNVFRQWLDEVVAYADTSPETNLEWLARAQHYGLATRLLDWTSNPLVALFFAVETLPEKDGIVYSYVPTRYIHEEQHADLSAIKGPIAYAPRPFDRRILAQNAEFTFHSEPEKILRREPLNVVYRYGADIPEESKVNLKCFTVKSRLKDALQYELNSIGVSRKSLFPDLGGLSEWYNWTFRRRMALRVEEAATL